MNHKLQQNTNFSELQSAKWLFFQKVTSYLVTIAHLSALVVFVTVFLVKENLRRLRENLKRKIPSISNLSNQFNIDGSFDDFLLENDDADEDVLVEEKDKNYLTHSLSEDTIAISKNFDDQCGEWYT